jgi:ABC-type Fe3+-hydroxamate transport system substrate-binding protein
MTSYKTLAAAAVAALVVAGAAAAVPATATVGPEALEGAGPQRAMAIANQWGAAKNGVTSFVTSKAVTFKFQSGKTVEVPLSKDRIVIAIAPYETYTHPCATHTMSSCKAEFPNTVFKVKAVDAQGKVAFNGNAKTLHNGFLEVWLPRDKAYTVTVEGRGKSVSGLISTTADSQTCIATFKLQ